MKIAWTSLALPNQGQGHGMTLKMFLHLPQYILFSTIDLDSCYEGQACCAYDTQEQASKACTNLTLIIFKVTV